MACISKLTQAIAYDCDSGATGLISAIIINKADIVSYTVNADGGVSGVALATGTKAYKIDTVKRSLVLSTALKVNDGAPNASTHSATIVSMCTDQTDVQAINRAFTNGSFVIIAKHVQNTQRAAVYGMYYGMSATAIDKSSHDNGSWTTITLETPENVIGEDACFMEAADYDALYAAAVG